MFQNYNSVSREENVLNMKERGSQQSFRKLLEPSKRKSVGDLDTEKCERIGQTGSGPLGLKNNLEMILRFWLYDIVLH